MTRILIATYGSLGDLHPAIALARGLQARGHEVELATSEMYRAKILALGLGFHALRPDLLAQGEHIIADIMDGPRGSERLMRKYLFPAVRSMHADLLPLIGRIDLLVTSELVFPAPIFAATHGVPWVSYQLAPVSLFSLHDPPVLPAPDAVRWLQRGGWLHRAIKTIAKRVSHSWWQPIRELRAELGLPAGGHPLFEGKYSPRLNLVLFSPVLQPPQPDWPRNTVQTGFLFHDEDTAFANLPPPVAEFLAAGEPPIVFTLGGGRLRGGRLLCRKRSSGPPPRPSRDPSLGKKSAATELAALDSGVGLPAVCADFPVGRGGGASGRRRHHRPDASRGSSHAHRAVCARPVR